MIELYGEDASARAGRYAEKLKELGDTEGHALWVEVQQTIGRIRSADPQTAN